MDEIWQVIPLAAFVSAAVTLGIRWFDRPRVMLRTEARLVEGPGMKSSHGQTQAHIAVLNDGDGTAYDVRFFGSNCDPAVRAIPFDPQSPAHWTYRLPSIGAGEIVRVLVGVKMPLNGDERLIIVWSRSPRRSIRRRMSVNLSEISGEILFPPGVLDLQPISTRVRRLRQMERQSPRARLSRQPSEVEDR